MNNQDFKKTLAVKAIVFVAVVVVSFLIMGAAATRQTYVGKFVGDGSGLTNAAASGGNSATATNAVNATNLWGNVKVANTNEAGSFALVATSDFLKFSADGSASGFQFYDFFNGSSTFQMRRKTDDGTTVLASIFSVASDVWTFGVPVTAGQVAYTTNSNPVVPDFTLAYQMFQTNAAFAFGAPAGVDATKTLFQSCVVFVTNSTAAAVAVTFPASIYAQGTANVTNLSSFTFSQYGQKWTNVVCFPMY